MKRAFKRTLQVTLAAAVAAGLNVGLLSTSASATNNTWIHRDGRCLEANNNADKVWAAPCQWGNRAQLWDRVGNQIKRAYTNQCLDSNGNGDVYWLECNGGNYQNWGYYSLTNGDFEVWNMQTGMWLKFTLNRDGDDVYTDLSGFGDAWRFDGGE